MVATINIEMEVNLKKIYVTHVGSLPRKQEVVDFIFSKEAVGPATPTLFIKASILFVFFITSSKNFETWISSDASQRNTNNFLLINGCFLSLLRDLMSRSQR